MASKLIKVLVTNNGGSNTVKLLFKDFLRFTKLIICMNAICCLLVFYKICVTAVTHLDFPVMHLCIWRYL